MVVAEATGAHHDSAAAVLKHPRLGRSVLGRGQLNFVDILLRHINNPCRCGVYTHSDGRNGFTWMNCRRVSKEVRPNPDGLKWVRAGIGAALQLLYSGVVREEIPDRLVELLRKLGQQKESTA